jgi:transposase
MPTVRTTSDARVVEAQRDQVELVPRDLESLLGEDHPARSVWAFVEQMELTGFYEPIKAREGLVGRSPTDPKVLIALWLFATTDGIGSAREVERLTECHDAYRWLRGGVPLNHHMLSDFRVAHQKALDELMTQSIAVLLNAGLVTLTRVAQDGTKVRANAGTSSFRRKHSLERCLREAEKQVEQVQRDAPSADGSGTVREQAARQRAAEDRRRRVELALQKLPEAEARRDRKSKEARVSTTDPEARVMKMGDGGYRPAYNVQFATDVAGAAVVGVSVVTSPADAQQMPPMLQDIERRCGLKPKEYLVDGGYTDFKSIETATAEKVVVYGPVPHGGPPKKGEAPKDPLVPTEKDSEAVRLFRLRMASDEGKNAYRQRAQTAELTNAEAKARGLTQFLVRGLGKVTCVALWMGLAINIVRLRAVGLL